MNSCVIDGNLVGIRIDRWIDCNMNYSILLLLNISPSRMFSLGNRRSLNNDGIKRKSVVRVCTCYSVDNIREKLY